MILSPPHSIDFKMGLNLYISVIFEVFVLDKNLIKVLHFFIKSNAIAKLFRAKAAIGRVPGKVCFCCAGSSQRNRVKLKALLLMTLELYDQTSQEINNEWLLNATATRIIV
jgi:hypothetical protein